MTRIFQSSDERGMALPMAVFALVVIGALVAGIFFTGRIEQRTGTNGAITAQAFESAEAGVAMQLANWSHGGLAVNQQDSILRTALGGKSAYRGVVERLSPSTFMLQVQGEQFSSTTQTDANLLSTRTVARLLKLSPIEVSITAALTTHGDVSVKGTADIFGSNSNPPGWGGCDAAGDVTGIKTTGEVNTNGSPTIEGDPAMEEYATDIVDSMFTRPFNQFKDAADFTLPNNSYSPAPSASGGVCNTNLMTNWGEPKYGSGAVTACQNHFPIIYRNGNLKLTNGRGQGILVVDGDLDLAGNFIFDGIIIVNGAFNASKGTNDVYGAVLARNANLDPQTFAGTPLLNYSACAVSRALSASAEVVPLAGRGWVQLY
jgi:hypothetical protein